MTWETEVAADSPLFLWTPDGFTAETIADESGNARSIVKHAWAEVPYGAWMDTTNFSIEAWFRTTNTGVNQIACREGAAPRVFQFRTNGANLEFLKLSSTTATVSNTSITANNGSYHHGVVTYDGTTVRVYADAGTPATGAATGALSGGTKSLQIGVRYNTTITALADLFVGDIPGLAYYNSVLSPTRIAAHFAAGLPTTSLTAWDGSGTWGP